MLEILGNRSFRHLFAAQIVALLGTGLATVALGLLAYDLSAAMRGWSWEPSLHSRWWPMSPLPRSPEPLPIRFQGRTMLVVLDCGSRRRCLPAALRCRSMADFHADFHHAGSVCGLHTDLSGHPARYSSRRERLYTGPLFVAVRLRSGESDLPQSGGFRAHLCQLSCALLWAPRSGSSGPGC